MDHRFGLFDRLFRHCFADVYRKRFPPIPPELIMPPAPFLLYGTFGMGIRTTFLAVAGYV